MVVVVVIAVVVPAVVVVPVVVLVAGELSLLTRSAGLSAIYRALYSFHDARQPEQVERNVVRNARARV